MVVRGVDVSRFQGFINWEGMPEWAEFTYIGVMDWQNDCVDRMARTNSVNASRTRVTGGYYRTDAVRRSGAHEAYYMLDIIGDLGLMMPGNLIPAVDIEPTTDVEGSNRVDWEAWTYEFMNTWYSSVKIPLMVYGSGSFLRDRIKVAEAWDYRTRCWVGHTAKWATPKGQTAEEFAGKTNFTFGGRTAIHQFDIDSYMIFGQPGVKFDRNQLMAGNTLKDITIPLG